MTSRAQQMLLEQEISALTKQIATARYSLATREFSLDASTEALVAAQKVHAMQRANLRHMRRKADLVVLSEFTKAKTSCLQAENDVAAAQVDLMIDRSEISKTRAFIEASYRRIDVCRSELKNFSVVLQFPSKAA